MTAESDSFSELANISSNENVMVFVETNYSSDDVKSFEVDVSSDNYSTSYVETFKTEGVSIEDYDRQRFNHTRNVITFDVVNNWYSGLVSWNLSDPSITNSTNLNENETLMVIVENNDTEQGTSRAEVEATVSLYVDKLKNAFEIRPLKIESLSTLSEGTNAVNELVVRNNLDSLLQFSWLFGTGEETISSDELINITSDDVFIFIESNYSSSEVYETSAYVNSSSYYDNETGVVVS